MKSWYTDEGTDCPRRSRSCLDSVGSTNVLKRAMLQRLPAAGGLMLTLTIGLGLARGLGHPLATQIVAQQLQTAPQKAASRMKAQGSPSTGEGSNPTESAAPGNPHHI